MEASTSCSIRSAATASPTACARCGEGGRLLVVGFTGGSIPEVRVNRLLLQQHRGDRRRLGCATSLTKPQRWPTTARRSIELIGRASCAPVVGARYPLERAADALALLDARGATGKVVLDARLTEGATVLASRSAATLACCRAMPGLIERYRERLPFAEDDPVVSLGEGSTPLVHAPGLSERVGAEVWCKLEGLNPTGSFKDRGMTCAVSAAVREGAQAIVCASTGNTAASAAAYAARAGIRCAVIVPEGKIATGKLAQALMHGARVIALRGNFDVALKFVRELASNHPIALVNSRQRVPDRGPEDGGVRDRRVARRRARRAVHPGRQRGQHHRLLARLSGARPESADARLPGRRAPRRSCYGAPVEHPETIACAIRIGNPARWEDAMNAMVASGGAVNAVTDEQILSAYRLLASTEGIFCEPASAASVAGLLVHGAGDARRIVCVLTGNGLKDPDTALGEAGRGGGLRRRDVSDRGRRPRMTLGRRRLVRVPASTANLGPGFDVMAAALALHLDLEVVETGTFAVQTDLPGVPHDRSNLVVRAFERLHPADDFEFRIASSIPLSGGLGSSAAAIVAGLMAADHLFELDADIRGWPPSSRATPTTSLPRCTAG